MRPTGLLAAILAVILLAVLLRMPSGLPAGKKGSKFKEVFSKNRNVNWLSAARVFLFGARDVWFVVGIPIYFYSVLSDGTAEGNRTAFFIIGVFMALLLHGECGGPFDRNATVGGDVPNRRLAGRPWHSSDYDCFQLFEHWKPKKGRKSPSLEAVYQLRGFFRSKAFEPQLNKATMSVVRLMAL